MITQESEQSHPLIKAFARLDAPLLIIFAFLVFFGLVNLYSASDENLKMVTRQLIHFLVGGVAMFVLAQMSSIKLMQFTIVAYFTGVVLLILVLFFGIKINGSRRWLYVGMTVQPSELLKVVLPMMVALYFSYRPSPARLLDGIAALLIIAIPVYLVFQQPDLGTAILIAMSGLYVVYLAGLSWWWILGALTILAASAPLVFMYILKPYQQERVMTLLQPDASLADTGYHINQSKITIGSGGMSGKGWLQGDQTRLEFLPERHTDFIFAVIGEEFGFYIVTILLLAYLILIFRMLYLATQARDRYGRLLGGGLALSFFTYLVVNTGMVTGLLPVVGVPLPLVSYGGSSIITLMAGIGIIMGMKKQKRSYPSPMID